MFFYNLKVVAATATTSINRIRVRDASATTELIYHMLAARCGIRGFQPSSSHKHTHTHTYTHIHTHTHTYTHTHTHKFPKKIFKRSVTNVVFSNFKFLRGVFWSFFFVKVVDLMSETLDTGCFL